MMNAIDLSYATLDTTALDGIDLVIQNLWTGVEQPPPRVINLRAAKNAGKRIAGYFAINPAVPWNIDWARAGVPDDLWAALEFVAPDCEFYTALTPRKVRDESDALAMMLPAMSVPVRPRVIYSVIDFWRDVLGDDHTLSADHWLWDARPDGRPFEGYGGWREDRVIGVQTSATVTIGTMEVDTDQFRLEVLNMATDPAADLRMKAAGAALNNDAAYLVALLVAAGVLPAGTQALKPALA